MESDEESDFSGLESGLLADVRNFSPFLLQISCQGAFKGRNKEKNNDMRKFSWDLKVF